MSVAPALALAIKGVLAAAAVSLLISRPALAIEFRSIAVAAAVLYDGPSAKARKIFILNRGYPVEVLFTVDGWLKVRDAAGELAWIEETNLSKDHMVMVKVARAEVRKAPDADAPVVLNVEQDVLLEVLDFSDNWVRVKHRDGAVGYIRVTQVWGL